MDYYEVEGKRLAAQYGIPVNSGKLYSELAENESPAFPCIAKAQVLSGKRGKAGGVKLVKCADELEGIVNQIKPLVIGGHSVEDILLDPACKIVQEHYLGFTMDRTSRNIVLIYSADGGMDIETLATEAPEKLLKLIVDGPLPRKELEAFAESRGVKAGIIEQLVGIAGKMYAMFCELDATTLEFNPLAEIEGEKMVALDTKLVIDDNALPRQKDYTIFNRVKHENAFEKRASDAGLAYVELEQGGTIGLIAGGAGIGMATVDAIKFYGEIPFNFLDLGGGVTADKTYAATKLLLDQDEVKGIVVNVFGGVNDCEAMAKGVCRAVEESGSEKPIVVKSRGFNQEKGWTLYDGLGLAQVRYGTTDQAIQKLVGIMKGAQQ